MNKKALFIGINYIRTPESQLRGCIDDVINMRNLLIDAYGYDLSNITVLRDDINNSLLLPTKQNILNALTTMVSNSANDTEYWFHYSGHGAKINLQSDSIIVPSDYITAGMISDNDLYAIFQNIKGRCFLLFDSCNSGNIVELPWTHQYISENQIIKTLINNHILANTEIYMYSGCKDTQTCADTYSADLRDYIGAFTNAFLTCLRNNKHEVDLLKLYSDICLYLSQNNFVQVPTFSSTIENPNYTFIREGSHITPNPCVIPKRINLSKLVFIK